MRSLKTYQIIRRRRHGYRNSGGESKLSFSPWVILPLCLLGLICAGILLWCGAFFSSLTSDLPSIERLDTWLDPKTGSLLQPTRFYDRSGQTLIQTLENRGIERKFLTVDPALPNHFSPQLVRAWVAMQQPDFWHSNGINTQNILNPTPVTIAEKLVSSLLLENEPESARKGIRMRLLAAQVIRKYGTGKVLDWYLNSVNFGHLAYGADSAAELFYGKSAADLDLMEASLLVAISESPALNPIDAPSHIDEIQKTALNRLLLAGVINSTEYINYLNEKPVFVQSSEKKEAATRPFIDLVVEQLSKTIGRQRLERGGLNVITSLDAATQKQLECTLSAQLGQISGTMPNSQVDENCDAGRLLPSINISAGELHDGIGAEGIITDPQTGEILAMTSDISLTGDATTASPHPPGSLLTPFLAAAAFARGYSPASLVWDIPDVSDAVPETQLNPDGKFHGPVSIRTAIANDYIAPLAKIFDEIGGENLQQIWSPFGLGKVNQAPPQSEILYEGGLLTPLQAAQSFGVFAANGQSKGVQLGNSDHLLPKVILAVKDTNGSAVVEPTEGKTVPILGQNLTFLINNILSDEDARKKSMGISNPYEIGRPAGGKAGQTATGEGLWSVEYTPRRLAAIWLGQKNEMTNSPLQLKMATGVTHALLQYISRELPVEGWDLPSGVSAVEVCDPSGELPTKTCPNIIQEVFLAGSEPTSTDPLYHRIAVNRETGRLATVFTPPELLVERTFLVVPAAYRKWAEQAGFPIAPDEYDTIQTPRTNPLVNITSPSIFSNVRGRVQILGNAQKENFNQYRLEAGQGLNPEEWVQIGGGNAPVQNGVLGEWDSSEKNGLFAIRLIVTDQEQNFDSAVIQVTVDNIAPSVKISYPKGGDSIDSHSSPVITLRVDAEDDVGVSRVEWWLDQERIGVSSQEPFVIPWTSTAGQHSLVARAFDLAGNIADSETVNFQIR